MKLVNSFDKDILFDNLSYLISQKGLKIGEFEKTAGVSQGYISRKSVGNGTKIKLDFVVRAASILDISIDRLLTTRISELTIREEYCLNFLDKLISDTASDKLQWFSYFYEPESPAPPTLCAYISGQWQYLGSYKNGEILFPCGTFLHTKITSDAGVHLSCVKTQDATEPDYEAWIVPSMNDCYDYGGRERFASTVILKEGRLQRKLIADKVRILYSCAKKSLSASLHLSSAAKNIIDTYMLPF